MNVPRETRARIAAEFKRRHDGHNAEALGIELADEFDCTILDIARALHDIGWLAAIYEKVDTP